jgi:hypothetical protein
MSVYNTAEERIRYLVVNKIVSGADGARFRDVILCCRASIPSKDAQLQHIVLTLHDLCCILITVNGLGIPSLKLQSLYAPNVAEIRPGITYIIDRILYDRVLSDLDMDTFNTVSNDLIEMFAKTSTVMNISVCTINLLRTFGVFSTDTGFSLLPDQSALLETFLKMLPPEYRNPCKDLYIKLTNIYETFPNHI